MRMRIPVLEGLAGALSWFPVSQKTLGSASPDAVSHAATAPLKQVPGGTPLSFCPATQSTDLFNISMVQIDQLPRPVHIDDNFLFYLYGTFQDTFSHTPNATINVTIDCGSHCEDYGVPGGQGDSFVVDFCEFSWIEQPLGGTRKSPVCPPEPGPGLIASVGYVWPMFIRAPGWYNFTFDAKTAEGKRIYCLTGEVCLRWEKEEDNKHYPKGPWSNCTWPR